MTASAELKNVAVWDVLRDLVAHETDPCRYDHHGYCQEHPGGTADMGCATAWGRYLMDLRDAEPLPPSKHAS